MACDQWKIAVYEKTYVKLERFYVANGATNFLFYFNNLKRKTEFPIKTVTYVNFRTDKYVGY